MVTWLKDKNIPSFKLKSMEKKTEFSIWKVWDKRNEVIKDPAGNEMKFPIKDGQLTDKDGQIRQVSDLQMMPRKQFNVLFPELTQNWRYIREIEVNGQLYNYGFTPTMNTKIEEHLTTCKELSLNPMNVSFELTQDKTKSFGQMYNIRMKMAQGATPPIIPSTTLTITPKEQEIIDAIKSVHGNKADEIRFVSVMTSNGVEELRAIHLFSLYSGG